MTPDADVSFWWHSPLGLTRCDGCAGEWPCHSMAWGGAHKTATCARCGDIVRWVQHDEPPPVNFFATIGTRSAP